MLVTRGLPAATPRPYPVAAIGNFDGHHRGHRALLHQVVDTARRAGGTALVLTFDPHPVTILAKQANLLFLTSPEEKLARFKEAGIDEVIFLEFTPAFAALSPEDFVKDVLHGGVGAAELFVGEHFAFGKGRVGTVADLIRLGRQYGFRVHPVKPVIVDGEIVSSTRIRHLIQEGRVERAAALLGRQYGISGLVEHGAKRGQSLGWPTANIRIPPGRVVPPDGIYAATVAWEGQLIEGAAYVGRRPTFGEGERLIEVYLLDRDCDLYGSTITVQFVERLRGDERFPSPEALARQIAVDVEQARASLQRRARERQP